MADTEEEDFDEGYSDLEKELLSHSGNYYDDYGNVVLKVIDPISENGDFSAYILTTRFQMNWNVNKDEGDVTDEKDKNLIKMEIVNNNMVLSSTSQEIGKIEENMSIEKDSDIDMKIAYSSKYMMEALRSLKCEKIEIKLNSEIKPIIIKNKDDDNLIQLVLPIKTF